MTTKQANNDIKPFWDEAANTLNPKPADKLMQIADLLAVEMGVTHYDALVITYREDIWALLEANNINHNWLLAIEKFMGCTFPSRLLCPSKSDKKKEKQRSHTPKFLSPGPPPPPSTPPPGKACADPLC